mmetsp:Transcript_145558/g.271020  ORF Transcript_145558/g.271020 Transcript_145558/m.271020 type:complete len:945 (+) Transcript_145558:52-2886(+)
MPSEGSAGGKEDAESLDSFEKKEISARSKASKKTDKTGSEDDSEDEEDEHHEGGESEAAHEDEEEEDEVMRKMREQAELEDAMMEEEYYEDEYGEGEEEDHEGGESEQEDEEDLDDDMDDYGEEGWEDDDDEEESEEESAGHDEEGGEDDEVKSDVAQTVSTVSNEIEVKSDLEYYDLDRQPAHVFPEPPWGGVKDQAKQVMISCLLPILLAILLLYAGFKFLQALAQCLVDSFNVGTALLWILIRLVFSPLVLIWKLFIPTYLQRYASAQYDQKIGRRIRYALALKRRVIAAIMDLPNVIVACSFAAFDTCYTPARANCGIVLYRYFGQYIDKYVFKPISDSNINRLTRRRKNHVYSNKGEHDIKMIKKKQEMIARKQKREARDKAKKLRVKKRQQEMNVTLQVADERNKLPSMMQTHQFEDKKSTEMISRTMIIERRYAVAIGFFWCVVGFAMLIKVLDGTSGERCTICNTNNEIEMEICRHGIGRDCAFNLHRIEISVAIVLMSMGVVLLVYSTFLYKPRGLSEEAAEKERAEKLAAAEKRVASAKRMEDADMLIINDVVDRLKKATVPRVARKVYMKSPCRGIYLQFSRRSTRPLQILLKWEDKNRLAERSIAFQQRLIERTQKFFLRRVPFLESGEERAAREELEEMQQMQTEKEEGRAMEKATSLQQKKASMMATRKSVLTPHYIKKKRAGWMKVVFAVFMPCLICAYAAWLCLARTPIPRLCSTYVKPKIKRCFRRCKRCFVKKSGPFGGDMVDHRSSDGMLGVGGASGGRAGRDGGGVSTLEDVLRRFGFLTEEEQAALDAEKMGGHDRKIEAERKKLVAEKPDPLGHVETQREAGLHDVDEGAESDDQVPRHTIEEQKAKAIELEEQRLKEEAESGSGSGSSRHSLFDHGPTDGQDDKSGSEEGATASEATTKKTKTTEFETEKDSGEDESEAED